MTDKTPPGDDTSDQSVIMDVFDDDDVEIRKILTKLRQEHRRIDNEIHALLDTGAVDIINIRRMKKLKLLLKDKITYLENQLTPDIIA